MERQGDRPAGGFLRGVLLGLGIFDVVLGGGALLVPDVYLGLMHPLLQGGMPLLPRTATLWLVFAAVELLAAATLHRDLVLAVAVLRLMDVPADLVYRATAPGLGAFGRASLVAAPAVNLAAGLWLLRRAGVVRGKS